MSTIKQDIADLIKEIAAKEVEIASLENSNLELVIAHLIEVMEETAAAAKAAQAKRLKIR